MHPQSWLCYHPDAHHSLLLPLPTLGPPVPPSPPAYPKLMHLGLLCCMVPIFMDCTHRCAAQHNGGHIFFVFCSYWLDIYHSIQELHMAVLSSFSMHSAAVFQSCCVWSLSHVIFVWVHVLFPVSWLLGILSFSSVSLNPMNVSSTGLE